MTNSKYKTPLTFLILIAIGLGIVFYKPSPVEREAYGLEKAYVTKVVDGDTIYADVGANNEKIRFVGMNTPEINLADGTDEYYGPEAFDYSKELLSNREIFLEADTSDRDQHGRMLRIIWLEDVEDLDNISFEDFRDKAANAILVKEGYAYAHVYPPDDKYGQWLDRLEKEARDKGLGIWSDYTNSNNIGLKIKGNKNSKIYHLPDGENYNEVSKKNAIYFDSEQEAIDAGYKRAKN